MKRLIENIIVFFLKRKIVKRIIIERIKRNWERNSEKYASLRKEAQKNGSNPRIVFGPIPILNIKYWSESLKSAGLDSSTLMQEFYSINKKEDYDGYFDDIVRTHLTSIPQFIKNNFEDYVVLDYLLKNKDIVVIPFSGFFNNKIDEAFFYKKFGIISVVIPYGGDFWLYSNITDNSYKYGLMANYPDAAKNEHLVREQVEYWNKNGDCVVIGSLIDGATRWDSFPFSLLSIDMEQWKPQKKYRMANGKDETVKIVHTPNHRYIKGTEFLITAVDRLKKEGIKVELILLEKVPNDKVRQVLCEEADILVEKLTYCVYGLSGAEGMAAGVAVVSNLENEIITRPFRRYSFLDECPLVSATPENVCEYLKVLITNPEFRNIIGSKGREFMEKYHSYEMFACFFKKVISKHWFLELTDLANYFHPLNPDSYNRRSPLIEHPLIENRIPAELMQPK